MHTQKQGIRPALLHLHIYNLHSPQENQQQSNFNQVGVYISLQFIAYNYFI